jgi:hypothetical protein
MSASDGGVIAEIAAERRRQVDAEGWTPDHDDEHNNGEIARAAACYARAGAESDPEMRRRLTDPYENFRFTPLREMWPWGWNWFKATDRRRDLVKAGALIVAEIERLDRKEKANG